MAILTYSPLVHDVRGPVGATLFKHIRGGNVAQRSGTAPKFLTGPQAVIRATVARLAAVWKTFDTAQRLKWIRYAAALKIQNPPPRLPGLTNPYNLFLAYNVPSVALGAAVAEAPPTAIGFNRIVPDIILQGYIGHFDFPFQSDPLYSGESLLIYAGRPFPKSQTNPRTWTWMTARVLGPKSTQQQFALPRNLHPNTFIRYTLVRHSTTLLDSLPRVSRRSFPA